MKKKNTKAKAATKAKPAIPDKSPFAVGALVEFYCPTARKRVQEEVTGHVPEHGYVTLESGRHFPASELTAVE